MMNKIIPISKKKAQKKLRYARYSCVALEIWNLLSQILGAKFGSGLSQLLDDGLFINKKKHDARNICSSVISVEQRFEIVYVFWEGLLDGREELSNGGGNNSQDGQTRQMWETVCVPPD
jgi:hypothetical protein